MRLVLFLTVSLAVLACESGKKNAAKSGMNKANASFLLDRRIPVYVNIYRSNGVLSSMLNDSLRKMGFTITDSVNAYRLYREGMFAIMRPTDKSRVNEVAEKSKVDKDYLVTLMNQSFPVYQYIYAVPVSSNKDYLWIGRQNLVRMTTWKFKIPYYETEGIEQFMSRMIDSLTGRK